ncbi:MAG: hypothetical protein QG591_1080 [Planctomycetota bacterium]|nr:hypothetical protein [Planctomycetota bacterium]
MVQREQNPCLNLINVFLLRKNVLNIFLIYAGQTGSSAKDVIAKNMVFIVAVFCTNVKIVDIKHL